MIVHFEEHGKIRDMQSGTFSVPFTPDKYGFFLEKNGRLTDAELTEKDGASSEYAGAVEDLAFGLRYEIFDTHLVIHVRIENGGEDFDGRIGFHTGPDTLMKTYPQWYEVFFPTLLRCEKTHLWGYFMNTAENALAIATDGPAASWDFRYNALTDRTDGIIDGGHRIYGADILFYGKAFVHEEEDGSMLTYGCRVSAKDGVLSVDCAPGTVLVYSLKNEWSVAGTDRKISGVGQLSGFNS